MSEPKQTKKDTHTFTLPSSLVGGSDLSKLIRELEKLDDFLYQTQIRTPGSSMQLPKNSRTLDEVSSQNHYSLLDTAHRKQLLEALKHLDGHAPVVHISFAVEASPAFASKIVAWMRQHIHEYLLVEIGLQPSVALGCVVRTNNKIFDMSLRNKFSEDKQILIKKLEEIEPKAAHPEPASAQSKPEASK